VIIDSHCHLEGEEYASDLDDVINRAKANNLHAVLSCGTTPNSNPKNVELADQVPMVFAAVGVHPHETYQMEGDTLSEIRKLGARKKVMAIGETGLDYHYNFSLPEVQRKGFVMQVRLARELGRPLVVHCRNAEEDVVNILKTEKASEVAGVLHCFTGSLETAKRCIDMGFYVGVSGVITFKNSDAVQKVISEISLDRLLVETDAPYLAPTPHRGKRNEPSFVLLTAKKLAELKSVPVEEVYAATTANAAKLFKLPIS